MDADKIMQDLNRRFAAPLPEFYKRRIIFWHDEDREFESLLDELDLPGVRIIKLTGTNNFAVKKLLLHDDLTGNYLIYDPFSHARPQDDWMRDIEHFSEKYRADYYSLLMRELNIDPKPMLRKTVRLYADFFKNKQRMEKLKKIGRSYETPLQLHIDIMAVLAGLNGGTAQDVIIAVLECGPDEENNSALNAIRQFGNIDAFWQLVQKYTGFIHCESPLDELAPHILLTALSQTMNPSVLKGLEDFISESSKACCYSIVHEWRTRKNTSELFRRCRAVEQKLDLSARFEKLEIETLLTGDIFPAIDEAILKRFFTEIADRRVKVDLMLKTADNRRSSGWSEQYADYYDCLYFIARMQEFYQAHAGGFHIVEPKKIWKFYTDEAYEMDSFYRHFHFAFGRTLGNSNSELEDSLKHAADYVEGLYQNWFLRELSDCWTTAAADNLTRLGSVPEIVKQRDFFWHYIKKSAAGNSRAFVIISDALRYEVAMELCDTITRTTRGSAKVEAVQAVFPTITKFGMAALLPGRELSVNDDMEVLMDGMQTRSTVERQKILCHTDTSSIAVQYQDVLNMKRAALRELVNGKSIVYIYHNTIDAIGDKAATEQKVFEACSDTIKELSNLIRIIVNDMQGTDVFITADHGFLYTYSPLEESDKLSKSTVSGKMYEAGRRYALTTPDTTADYLLPVQMDREIAGTPVKGFTPRDTTRIKVTGGGANYVHGGISLQEMLVPVIVYKNLRASSKKYVEVSRAELKLLSESRKVSNLLFSLDFFQSQPIGEKIQPCTYTICMIDDEGKVISDKQSVIADRASARDFDRKFRVRLNLKAGAYDNNKIYRLVIKNGIDAPQEEEFHINIAFADDFGFDL